MNPTATVLLAVSLFQGQCVDNTMPTHDQWDRGDCASCHEDDPPGYHTEIKWNLVHGRSTEPLIDNCARCHESTECVDCHKRKPASHTSGFLHSGAHGPDRRLHATLGRLRPSACTVCHETHIQDCATCHTPEEVWQWQSEAAVSLAPWRPLLDGE